MFLVFNHDTLSVLVFMDFTSVLVLQWRHYPGHTAFIETMHCLVCINDSFSALTLTIMVFEH